MLRYKKLNQSGETIVEVLIAIAVVSSVLGIAYSIMNRNLIIMRDNQERSEAIRLAQSQIEALKSLWDTSEGRSEINGLGNAGFCVGSDNNIVTLTDGAPNANSAADGNFEGYRPDEAQPNTCRFEGLYHAGIRREASGSGYMYKAYVRWDRLGGGQTDKNEAIIVYRLN